MSIPTEPIGSIPRPPALLEGIQEFGAGRISQQDLDSLYDAAVLDTIQRFEATGSPVISDGEQRKGSFATYPVEGLQNLAPDGVAIPFADGHVRRLPLLTAGPFPVQDVRRDILVSGEATCARAREAGGHLRIGVESVISRERH